MSRPICIYSEPAELEQGLFGQTFYYILQLLPYLHAEGIFPQWELRSEHYGDPPDRLTVPGVLELAYTPPQPPYRRYSLTEMRRRHAHVLGNDWQSLHHLWNLYFKIPDRVIAQADAHVLPGRVLGIHYRGTDKQTTSWDSNPISQQDYLTLIQEFRTAFPGADAIFAATDDFTFVELLRGWSDLPVHSLGEVEFHMAAKSRIPLAAKADRALLDCVLLSRCAGVLETSSALPSFAKLLNPGLEIYRCAASKLFGKLYTHMPYFPVAQIPIFPAKQRASLEILARTLESDWTEEAETQPYQRSFVATPRWPRNDRAFRLAERWGVDTALQKVLRGYR